MWEAGGKLTCVFHAGLLLWMLGRRDCCPWGDFCFAEPGVCGCISSSVFCFLVSEMPRGWGPHGGERVGENNFDSWTTLMSLYAWSVRTCLPVLLCHFLVPSFVPYLLWLNCMTVYWITWQGLVWVPWSQSSVSSQETFINTFFN